MDRNSIGIPSCTLNENIKCTYCSETFSNQDHIPKILECRHTYCSECVMNFLRFEKRCPTCNIRLCESFVKDYLTDFNLIKITETRAISNEYLSTEKKISMITLKNLKLEFNRKKSIFQQKMEEETAFYELITRYMEIIQQILDKDINIIHLMEFNNFETELHKDLKEFLRFENLNARETYSLSSDESPAEFLCNIYKRLDQGEIFYVLGYDGNGNSRYGKFSSNQRTIFAHALTSSTIEKDAIVILLQDLKKCVKKQKFFTFMDIQTEDGLKKKLYFTLANTSALALQFIKLCSGELGPTFKNSCFKTVNNGDHLKSVEIENYLLNNIAAEGCIDYDLSYFQNESDDYFPDKLVVKMYPKGKCSIMHSKEIRSYTNVVAKLINFDEQIFLLPPGTIINDCGLAFYV